MIWMDPAKKGFILKGLMKGSIQRIVFGMVIHFVDNQFLPTFGKVSFPNNLALRNVIELKTT